MNDHGKHRTAAVLVSRILLGRQFSVCRRQSENRCVFLIAGTAAEHSAPFSKGFLIQ